MKVWLLAALLFTASAQAQFDIAAEGKVFLPNGSQQEFDFGFSFFVRMALIVSSLAVIA